MNGYRQGTNVAAGFYLQYPVPMRITPTLSHNITEWSNSWVPTGTQVSMYNAITVAVINIIGALTVNITPVDKYISACSFTAATSFNGTAGDVGALGFGSNVRLIFSADL